MWCPQHYFDVADCALCAAVRDVELTELDGRLATRTPGLSAEDLDQLRHLNARINCLTRQVRRGDAAHAPTLLGSTPLVALVTVGLFITGLLLSAFAWLVPAIRTTVSAVCEFIGLGGSFGDLLGVVAVVCILVALWLGFGNHRAEKREYARASAEWRKARPGLITELLQTTAERDRLITSRHQHRA